MTTPNSPALSTASSSASATTVVVETTPNSKSLVNLRKQLKYVVIGGTLTWYFQVGSHVGDSLSLGVVSTWEGRIAALAVAFLAGTVGLFGYVILLPARGHQPGYADWTNDAHLARAIPALTACIVVGWTALLLTLSPVGAPPPPPLSLATRISQAAQHIGLSPPSISTTGAGTIDAIASRLALSPAQQTAFRSYLSSLTTRAEAWAALNIRTIGWTGALAGSLGAYLLVFGSVGLLGFFAPDNRPPKAKQF